VHFPRSPAAAEGDEDQEQSQSTPAVLVVLQLQLQLSLMVQLLLVALARAEQRSRARGKGVPVRAQGWASSRWAQRLRCAPAPGRRGLDLAAQQDASADKAAGEQRRAPCAARRGPPPGWLWLLSPKGK
jgi:hypothetical protein